VPDVLLICVPAVLGLLPFGFLAVFHHDRLVRRLYERHRDEWSRLGGPVGFFWRPPEGLGATSLMAFMKSSMMWAFRLPEPPAKDAEARRPHILMRIGLILWNLGCLALFAFLFTRYGFPPR
jgi:hypothetical protein